MWSCTLLEWSFVVHFNLEGIDVLEVCITTLPNYVVYDTTSMKIIIITYVSVDFLLIALLCEGLVISNNYLQKCSSVMFIAVYHLLSNWWNSVQVKFVTLFFDWITVSILFKIPFTTHHVTSWCCRYVTDCFVTWMHTQQPMRATQGDIASRDDNNN